MSAKADDIAGDENLNRASTWLLIAMGFEQLDHYFSAIADTLTEKMPLDIFPVSPEADFYRAAQTLSDAIEHSGLMGALLQQEALSGAATNTLPPATNLELAFTIDHDGVDAIIQALQGVKNEYVDYFKTSDQLNPDIGPMVDQLIAESQQLMPPYTPPKESQT